MPAAARAWSGQRRSLAIATLLAVGCLARGERLQAADQLQGESAAPLTIVVMDPLAKPLSCPCVKGYAQRDYDRLAERLQSLLGRPTTIVFDESLAKALAGEAGGRADLIIGKCSVVRADAGKRELPIHHVAMLTDKEGLTTQTGLIVVPKDDPAKTAADLKDYRIIFGPGECDEKNAAPVALLKQNGVAVPAELETSPACSDGACLILELGADVRGAAVISSYARPLLEGCGTVEKGALRVVAETEPVPFVGAFVCTTQPAEQARIAAALIKATRDPVLRVALETRNGFVAIDEPAERTAKKK